MKKGRGFTLVEIMIVAAIVAILAAMAVPNFMSHKKRARAMEAKQGLGSIRSLQEVYKAEYYTYTSSMANLGWATPSGNPIYTYVLIGGTAKSWSARATANLDSDATLDIWKIDQKGNITHPSQD